MRPTHHRAARLDIRYRRDDFVAAVELILPHVSKRAELIGMYCLVCAFWGLIVYLALALALV